MADAIQMTRWADENGFFGESPRSAGIFSPDGSQFIVVVKKGNLEHNTNDYSLLLFPAKDALRGPGMRVLLTMSSSSNREAVKGARWLNDNKTVVFLGENPGHNPEVYSLNVATSRLTPLTNHPTPVAAFDISDDGSELVYEADPPPKKILNTAETRKDGIVITTEHPSDLLIGDCNDLPKSGAAYKELFVKRRGRAPLRVATRDFVRAELPLSVSPDGRYALLAMSVAEVPASWSSYDDSLLHPYIVARRESGTPFNVQQYFLLDTKNLRTTALINGPMSWHNGGFAWNPDSTSVVLSGIYLPLDGVSPAARELRKTHAFVAEIKIPSKEISEVTGEAVRVSTWDRKTGSLYLEQTHAGENPLCEVYKRSGSRWTQMAFSADTAMNQLTISVEQDMNTPPRIFAADEKTGQKQLLLDLNPQFDDIQFGGVEAVEWKATDGHEVIGGLYLPPDFAAGTRYPLVIQTHGFNREKFWIDGPYTSAFAAQPLAALGFIVLQVGGSTQPGEDAKYSNTPKEAARQMAAYEGAIDYLLGRGLIDPARVGIIGFSRTVFYVEYTLTHSKYHFVAATVADGFDGGFVNSLLWGMHEDYDGVMGGSPAGPALVSWLANSPGFNLDKVTAAVRVEGYGSTGTLAGWQWFAGLVEFGKPVDFIWLPFGTHILVRPWERFASQQGNVDWFAFWLKGDEIARPGSARQYDRWKKLRTLQRQNSDAAFHN